LPDPTERLAPGHAGIDAFVFFVEPAIEFPTLGLGTGDVLRLQAVPDPLQQSEALSWRETLDVDLRVTHGSAIPADGTARRIRSGTISLGVFRESGGSPLLTCRRRTGWIGPVAGRHVHETEGDWKQSPSKNVSEP
jgi:hypothetical protein